MTLNHFNILVVDDDPLNTKTLVDVFSLNGFSVNAAGSAGEALKLIERQQFRVVLSDIRMPEMNGVELFRKVKSIQPDTLFILMTAYADDNLLAEGMQEGALAIMVKPLNIDKLIFHISNLAKSQFYS